MNKDLKKPLIMDGAMGTELMRRGIELPLPLWSSMSNIDQFDQVMNIHKDYIEAGSDILTTNTFRTTPRTFIKAGYSQNESEIISEQCCNMAIEAAKHAVKKENTLIAGSVAPLEDCYEPLHFPGKEIAKKEFQLIIDRIIRKGVDILLFETMGNYEEIESVLQVSNHVDIQRWLSIVLKNKNSILDGTELQKVVELANKNKIDMVLINCTPVNIILEALDIFLGYRKGKWGVYPNAGENMPTKDGEFVSKLDDESFCKAIQDYITLGASVVGSCCGSTPNTVRKISNMIKKL
jgi:homocysteine S-methyltransferase